MARPKKKFSNPEQQKRHEAKLAKRRERHREARTMELASQAAESETDFATLVEAERERQNGLKSAQAARAGSKSPKIMSAAREDLAIAFDLMGGVPALVVWGRSNPTDFYRLWSKLIPSNAQAESTAMPLEALLEKLATKEEKTVGVAAMEIGQELIDKGRQSAEAEDLANLVTKGNA